MSPIAMAFWRWFGALVLLLPFVIGPMLRERETLRRNWKVIGTLSVLGVGAFNIFTYTGLKYTTATNGVLLNSVIPILIIAIGVVVLREPLRARQAAGVLVSLAGVLTIVSRGEGEALLHFRLNPGDVWILGGMLCWAVYTVVLRW